MDCRPSGPDGDGLDRLLERAFRDAPVSEEPTPRVVAAVMRQIRLQEPAWPLDTLALTTVAGAASAWLGIRLWATWWPGLARLVESAFGYVAEDLLWWLAGRAALALKTLLLSGLGEVLPALLAATLAATALAVRRPSRSPQ